MSNVDDISGMFAGLGVGSSRRVPPAAVLAGGELPEDARLERVTRKKDFRSMERVGGRMVNVLAGLELHAGVFGPEDQRCIVKAVLEWQDLGRRGLLRDRTYTAPSKWMRGKGRVTLQYGCCYIYATDARGNPPGIKRDEEVDPLPPLLKKMIKRMVEWQVLPRTCIPNSCIINIYDRDDCIPPHIDHHDFVRPFCTVSFLSECNILFGAKLKSIGPGEFEGSTLIPLPLGSVLVMKGNAADVAQHCIPAVSAKRISITFRKMDDGKIPYNFFPDPELENIRPLSLLPVTHGDDLGRRVYGKAPQGSSLVKPAAQMDDTASIGSFKYSNDDFPPLGGAVSSGK